MPPNATQHLTRLDFKCSTEDLSTDAILQLSQLTALHELHLPRMDPPEGTLAPALSYLTCLTKLYIIHPLHTEQQAMPTSPQELVLAPLPTHGLNTVHNVKGKCCPDLFPLKL